MSNLRHTPNKMKNPKCYKNTKNVSIYPKLRQIKYYDEN